MCERNSNESSASKWSVERDPELSSVSASLLMPLTVVKLLSQTVVCLQLQVDNDLITQFLDR